MDTDSSIFEVLEYPEISKDDKKQLRVIRLANGMKVILVQDDKVKENKCRSNWPSCALGVAVGSLSDPSDLPGLAQCLGRSYHPQSSVTEIDNDNILISEHMIRHGDNEFNRFIGKNAEHLQSSTSCDETTFAFLSTVNSIDEALGHFANIFKSPLSRETVSVVREHIQSTFESKQWDYCDELVFPLLGNPGHPSCQYPFINVNLDNVDDDTLYQRFEEFRNRHYSAHRMCLCLRMNLPLNQIKVGATSSINVFSIAQIKHFLR